MHTWGREVNNGEESDLCSDMIHSKWRAQRVQRPLGGQTQKEAADEPAGQDDVPFYKVRGLRGRGEKTRRMSRQDLKSGVLC